MVLISHEMLSKWNSAIDFKQSTMGANSIRQSLRRSISGHLVAKMKFTSVATPTQFGRFSRKTLGKDRNPVETVSSEEVLFSNSQLEKLPLQPGHCNQHTLEEVLRRGKREVSSRQTQNMITKCGCVLSRVVTQRLDVRTRIPLKYGDILGMDMFCLSGNTGRIRRHLMLVDHLNHYTLVCWLNSHVPQYVVDAFLRMWGQSPDKPRRIIADRGHYSIGEERDQILDGFEVQMTLCDREIAVENGTVEGTVGLIKIVSRVICVHCPTMHDGKTLIRPYISEKLIANARSGYSPSPVMLGKSNLAAQDHAK